MDDKKLDLNLLLALEALLAELNVTRAAKRLNLSQPALSAQLARLRDIFSDQLLIPTSRGVSATAMATELQVPLRHALDQMRALVSRARSFDPANAKIIFGISASDYMQVTVLLPFVTQLHVVAPDVQVMVRAVHEPKADLERGDVDVAFLQSSEVEGTEFRYLDVLRERYIGVTRKQSFTAGVMTMERFIAARHVIVSPRATGFRGSTDDALEAIGLTRKVAVAVSSFVMMIEAVAESELIALAPERLAARYADRVDTFEPPLPVSGFRIAMVWHERTHDHPARAWLRAQLAQFCAHH
ncbi:LysR family transcriptional regulator [Acidisphaera sp. L21]|uniref:LysR family transcriptional regulator n=1 Tax=Acidisphaera sp. L21 TaxID=1641851 RepID=UPI00131C4FBA|nr:LysR family transcriptional regulator [Acidisphaera sp. L21]